MSQIHLVTIRNNGAYNFCLRRQSVQHEHLTCKDNFAFCFNVSGVHIVRYKVDLLNCFLEHNPFGSGRFSGINKKSQHCFVRFSKYKIVTSRIPVEVDPILNVNTVCKNTPSLHKEQLELCKTHADVVASALQGAQLAVHECQRQLRYYRWNCSALETKNSNPLTSPLLARG